MLNSLSDALGLYLLTQTLFLEVILTLVIFEQKSLHILNPNVIKNTFFKKILTLKKVAPNLIMLNLLSYIVLFVLTWWVCFYDTGKIDLLLVLATISLLRNLEENDYPLLMIVVLISVMHFIFKQTPNVLMGLYILFFVDHIINKNIKVGLFSFITHVFFLLTLLYSVGPNHFSNIYSLMLLLPLLLIVQKLYMEFLPSRKAHSRLYIRLALIVFGLAIELGWR